MDLVVGTGVLPAELIAGEAEDDELVGVFGLDVLVEGLEAFELRGEAALGGGVDGEDYLGEQHVSFGLKVRVGLKVPCPYAGLVGSLQPFCPSV